MFWGNVKQNPEENFESSRKRTKYLTKFEAFYDLINQADHKVNWPWFIIFSEFLLNHSDNIDIDDIKTILQFLVNYQPKIIYPSEIKSFAKCCDTLIKKENEFNGIDNELLINWDKLINSIYRLATNQIDYHEVLSILIKNKRFLSKNFIQQILTDFSMRIFPRKPQTFKNLETILIDLDIDSIENGLKLIEDCLLWINKKSDILHESLMSTHENEIQLEDITRLTVICMLCGHGSLKLNNSNDIILNENEKFENNLRYASLDLIIVTNLNFNESNEKINPNLSQIIRCVIDRNLLENMMDLLKFNSDIQNKINIHSLLINIETILLLLNYLIKFEAINDSMFNELNLIKKLKIFLQMMEKNFEDIKVSEMETNEKISILLLLNKIFSLNFHPKICIFMRQLTLAYTLKFVIDNSSISFADSNRIKIINCNNLNGEHLQKFLCFKLLIIYCYYDGNHSNDIIGSLIKNSEDLFNLYSNADLNTLLYMIKVS